MQFSRWQNFLIVLIMVEILATSVSFVFNDNNYFIKQTAAVSASPVIVKNEEPIYMPPQKLSNPPEIIKAVYVTGYSAGTKKYLNYLSNVFKNTEINSVVVDIKGSSGYVSYASGVEDVKKYNLYRGAVKDIDALVRFFHDQNIYVIGRIAVFEDPMYSKARPELAIYNKSKTLMALASSDNSAPITPILWQDNNKLSWLDPASKDVWDYNISLAKDAFYHGFDEINFDYVRFPSDGKTDNMGFPIWDGEILRSEIIKEFFEYTRQQLIGEKISVDLFGQTTTNKDDMGIGQLLENSFENFDYVSPMVYPSHYAKQFLGFSKPAEHPYEIIKYSMEIALSREKIFLEKKQALDAENNKVAQSSIQTANLSGEVIQPAAPILDMASIAKLRPWLQDFDMGADYNAEMVRSEIVATQDALGADYNGFMLWNPSNIYTIGAVSLTTPQQ